jgi:hypothetical protein
MGKPDKKGQAPAAAASADLIIPGLTVLSR